MNNQEIINKQGYTMSLATIPKELLENIFQRLNFYDQVQLFLCFPCLRHSPSINLIAEVCTILIYHFNSKVHLITKGTLFYLQSRLTHLKKLLSFKDIKLTFNNNGCELSGPDLKIEASTLKHSGTCVNGKNFNFYINIFLKNKEFSYRYLDYWYLQEIVYRQHGLINIVIDPLDANMLDVHLEADLSFNRAKIIYKPSPVAKGSIIYLYDSYTPTKEEIVIKIDFGKILVKIRELIVYKKKIFRILVIGFLPDDFIIPPDTGTHYFPYLADKNIELFIKRKPYGCIVSFVYKKVKHGPIYETIYDKLTRVGQHSLVCFG